jgi:uncharacterized sulfatase
MVTMMKRKILSRTTIFLAMSKLSFILAVNPFGLSVQGADAPNIIFLFTDDQAAWAVGANDSQAKTPHMDRLFKEGAHLENAFTVTPVCSPSRASLMTSRYGTELGITDWIHPRREPNLGLSLNHLTFPELLNAHGYFTGLVGKWHLGRTDEYHPTKMGFDYFMGHRDGGWAPVDPVLENEGQQQKFKGLTADVLGEHAIKFVRKHREERFFLAWHTRAPHARWLPVSDEDWAPYEGFDPQLPHPDYPDLNVPRAKRMTREYLASVRSVDRNLGELLTVLEELKLTQNTVILFSSDHGYNMGHNGIWHKGNGHWLLADAPPASQNIPKGQRPNMYDTSIKVPTAVWWPARIKKGIRISETVSNLDWYPTILDIAGIAQPKNTVIRGRSFLPLLLGDSVPNWDNDLYAEYSTKHQSHTHMRMYRTPEWKLVRDFMNPDRDELFDLVNDPMETTNLLSGSKGIATESIFQDFSRRIYQQMETIGDIVVNASLTDMLKQ